MTYFRVPGVYFLFLSVLLIACQEKENHSSVDEQEPGQIVLLFDDPPENGFYHRTEAGPYVARRFELEYMSDDFELIRLDLQAENFSDVHVIFTNRQEVELRHFQDALKELSFIVEKGDSVLFRYDGKRPVVSILNRDVDSLELNYHSRIRDSVFREEVSEWEKSSSLIMFVTFPEGTFPTKEDITEQERVFLEAALAETNDISLLIESDWEENQILKPHLEYRIRQNGWKTQAINLRLGLISSDSAASLLDPDLASLYSLDYLLFLTAFKESSVTQTIPLIPQKQGAIHDHPSIFDQIVRSYPDAGASRDWMLYTSLEEIANGFPLDVALRYISRFDSLSLGGFDTQKLIDQYRLNTPISGEIALTSLDAEETSLSEILSSSSSDIVLLDFWASWCKPCIESFPESSLLEQRMGEQVSIVYLSVDDNQDAWEKSSTNLLPGKKSYLITNKRSSTLFEDLDVSTIPRYIVMTREAELLHRNAPRPGSPTLDSLLLHFIGQN